MGDIEYGFGDWGDYDNDGYLDILLSGLEDNSNRVSKIYRNNGDNSFSEQTDIILRGVLEGSVDWGDYDNDGDLDILLSGESKSYATTVYRNDGNNIFTELDFDFAGLNYSTAAWGDYDSDGDLDILIAGYLDPNNPESFTAIYQNNGNWENNKPAAPTNLLTEKYGYGILLKWDAAIDDQTPSAALSYNLRVGTSSGGYDIVAPMSDIISGDLLTPQMGYCNLNTQWHLDSLAVGKYYWSVQAVDNSFLGGEWATEQTFIITTLNAEIQADTVCFEDTTQFTDKTLTAGDSIIAWKWYFGDGDSSSLQNPTHLYAASGTYDVTLISSTDNYTDTAYQTIVVKHKPIADFTADIVCYGIPTTFINNSFTDSVNVTSWYWDFGDDLSTSIEENPGTYGYINYGSYTTELIVNADNGCSDTINKEVVVAKNPSSLFTVAGDLDLCYGDTVSITATYNSDYNYRWIKYANYITGEDSNIINIAGYSSSGYYRAEITNPVGNCVTVSDTITVTLLTSPSSLTIEPLTSPILCEGDSVLLYVADMPDYTYEWGLNNAGVIGGDTNILKVKPGLVGTFYYNLKVTNSNGCESESANTQEVIVRSSPEKPVIIPNGVESICKGNSLQLSVPSNTDYTYYWKVFGGAAGSDTNIFTINPIFLGPYRYSVEVMSANGCSKSSDENEIDVLDLPIIPAIYTNGSTTLCEGDTLVINSDDNSIITYQWKKNDLIVKDGTNYYTVDESGDYTLSVTRNNGCISHSPDTIHVSVNPSPEKGEIEITDGKTKFCSNETIVLSIDSVENIFYQWRLDGRNIPNAINTSYNVTESGNYVIKISNLEDCAVFDSIEVEIYEQPSTPVIDLTVDSLEVCPGELITLNLESVSSDYNYKWQRNGNDYGEVLSTLQDDLDEGDYTVIAYTSEECESESQAITINHKDALPVPELAAFGPVWWYLACGNDTAENYRWYYNGDLINGAIERDYVAGQNLGEYYVEVNDGGECYVPSEVITIPLGSNTGIEKESVFGTIKIYPNPTPGLFTIEIENNLFGELMIDINNEAGVRILMMEILKNHRHFKTNVDLSGQGKGLYFIGFKFDNNYTVRKLVVE
ncbi:PKD domain-containing protein [Bacteroidota bacterium]